MNPVITAKNKNVVYPVLQGRCNVFIVRNQKNCVLVDTSVARCRNALFAVMDSFIREGCVFKGLIITHAHFDHVMNAHMVKQKYTMKIYIHEREKDFLSQGESPAIVGTNAFLKILTSAFRKPIRSFARYTAVAPDICVGEDEFRLDSLGINAYLLHTPGHSAGSMSVIVDNEIALVGDTMVGAFPNSNYPPFAADAKLLMQSWKKLMDTNCRLFMPSHGKARPRDSVLKQYDKRRAIEHRVANV